MQFHCYVYHKISPSETAISSYLPSLKAEGSLQKCPIWPSLYNIEKQYRIKISVSFRNVPKMTNPEERNDFEKVFQMCYFAEIS